MTDEYLGIIIAGAIIIIYIITFNFYIALRVLETNNNSEYISIV